MLTFTQQSRRFWDVTETGNPITPSRVSILETLSKVTADPPKLQSKSSIGFIENIFFQIKNSWIYHPVASSIGVSIFLVIAIYVLRVVGVLRPGKGGSGNVNAWGMSEKKGGYFQVGSGDDKGLGGLLGGLGVGGGGNANGKADQIVFVVEDNANKIKMQDMISNDFYFHAQ